MYKNNFTQVFDPLLFGWNEMDAIILIVWNKTIHDYEFYDYVVFNGNSYKYLYIQHSKIDFMGFVEFNWKL